MLALKYNKEGCNRRWIMSLKYIFDLDGTIVDTEHGIAEITANVAQKKGCPISAKEVFEKYAGMSFKDKFADISKRFGRPFSPEELQEMHADHKAQKEDMFSSPELKAIKRVHNLIQRLATHPNAELTLATSNQVYRAKNVLKSLGLLKYFGDRIYGSDLVDGRKKPDPAVHNLAVGDHPASRCVIIEDSLVGVQSASLTGAFVVNYFDPRIPDADHSKRKAFKQAGADMILSDYDAFESEMEQNYPHWGERSAAPKNAACNDQGGWNSGSCLRMAAE